MEQNAVVESVSLTSDYHGCLTAWLHLSYGGLHLGFGGNALYLPKSFDHHKLNSPAGHFIYRTMEICGVTSWDKIVGKSLRVRKGDGFNDTIDTIDTIDAIGHIINDDWFSPEEDFKLL